MFHCTGSYSIYLHIVLRQGGHDHTDDGALEKKEGIQQYIQTLSNNCTPKRIDENIHNDINKCIQTRTTKPIQQRIQTYIQITSDNKGNNISKQEFSTASIL